MKTSPCDLRTKSKILAVSPAYLQPHHMPPPLSSSNIQSSSLPQGLCPHFLESCPLFPTPRDLISQACPASSVVPSHLVTLHIHTSILTHSKALTPAAEDLSLLCVLLGLGCCARAFSTCQEQGPLFIAGGRLLTVVASLAAEHGLWGTWGSAVGVHRLSCGAACGIFLDQGLNPCPWHRQADSHPLSHQGSPIGATSDVPRRQIRLSSMWQENPHVQFRNRRYSAA